MGGYSFADHMFALNCGLLSVVLSILTGVTIFIVISVLFLASYIIALGVMGWFHYLDRRAARQHPQKAPKGTL